MGWSLGSWIAFVAIVGVVGTIAAWCRHDADQKSKLKAGMMRPEDTISFVHSLRLQLVQIWRESKS